MKKLTILMLTLLCCMSMNYKLMSSDQSDTTEESIVDVNGNIIGKEITRIISPTQTIIKFQDLNDNVISTEFITESSECKQITVRAGNDGPFIERTSIYPDNDYLTRKFDNGILVAKEFFDNSSKTKRHISYRDNKVKSDITYDDQGNIINQRLPIIQPATETSKTSRIF